MQKNTKKKFFRINKWLNMNYNKNDIINYIYKKKIINKKKINIIIKLFFKKIIYFLKKKYIIKIKNFGKFFLKKIKKKIWINPNKKNKNYIPSKKIIRFKYSKKFKKKINKFNY